MIRLAAAFALTLLALAPAASAQAPSPQAGREIVIGRSYTIRSAILGDERRLNVYLPAHYADPSRRFPVLILLDGGEAEDFHPISGLAQITAANGFGQELIVVGIEGVDRRHDLTPVITSPADRQTLPKAGGADAYRRFLIEEVKPWVAAHYRTSGRTGLVGESLAGLFTLETLLKTPGAFDDYIASSPSLWLDDQALSKAATDHLRKGAFNGKRLWIGLGGEGPEMQAGADRVVAALKAAAPTGLTWTFDPRPTERHDTTYVPVVTAALRSFYPLGKP
ncbi:alpha/beta hydrolase [soil metagenome]